MFWNSALLKLNQGNFSDAADLGWDAFNSLDEPNPAFLDQVLTLFMSAAKGWSSRTWQAAKILRSLAGVDGGVGRDHCRPLSWGRRSEAAGDRRKIATGQTGQHLANQDQWLSSRNVLTHFRSPCSWWRLTRKTTQTPWQPHETLFRVFRLWEILQCVFRFGQMVGGRLKPEDKEVVRSAYASVTGPPEIQRAVNAIGVACFVVAQQDAVTTAVNTYMAPLVDSPANAVRRVVLEIVAATGQACGQLDMKFNWK